MLFLGPLNWEGREKKRPEQRGREPPQQGCLVRKDFGFDFMQKEVGKSVQVIAHWSSVICDLTCIFKGSFWLLGGDQAGEGSQVGGHSGGLDSPG